MAKEATKKLSKFIPELKIAGIVFAALFFLLPRDIKFLVGIPIALITFRAGDTLFFYSLALKKNVYYQLALFTQASMIFIIAFFVGMYKGADQIHTPWTKENFSYYNKKGEEMAGFLHLRTIEKGVVLYKYDEKKIFYVQWSEIDRIQHSLRKEIYFSDWFERFVDWVISKRK